MDFLSATLPALLGRTAAAARDLPMTLFRVPYRAAATAGGVGRAAVAGATHLVAVLSHVAHRGESSAPPPARPGAPRVERPPTPEAPESSAELPVERWDERSPASLRPSVRTVPKEDLLVLLAWERSHAARPPVVTMLENRIAKLDRGPDGETAAGSGPAPA